MSVSYSRPMYMSAPTRTVSRGPSRTVSRGPSRTVTRTYRFSTTPGTSMFSHFGGLSANFGFDFGMAAGAGAQPVEENTKELRVRSHDFHIDQNRKEHKTEEYEQRSLIVRRGQDFCLDLDFNRPLADSDKYMLIFATGQNPKKSKGTLVQLSPTSKPDPKEWSMVEKARVNGNRVCLIVHPPADAVVGAYTLTMKMTFQDEEGHQKVKKQELTEKITVLFNPWHNDDQVFLDDESQRQEYVMNETGRVYVGNSKRISGRPWNFGQFEESALEVALYLLDISYLQDEARGNPTRVTRALSALINSSDDNGVLEGRWSGGYQGGTPPTSWNGSVAILDEYWMTKRPVKFGQCWVFSGVTTTLCRALGIPTRSVTNFQSAHDSDCSLTCDEHRDQDGRPLSDYDDSIWNFHVWNESWFKRPDLPFGNDGWQAFDATPQERSEGMFRCGPAPVKAIKEGDVYCGYDAPFIYAEVNGDYIVWMVDEEGDAVPINNIKNNVGNFISTKAVGSSGRADVTLDYKYPEGSTAERQATQKAWRYSSRRAGLQAIVDSLQGYDCTFSLAGDVHQNGDVCAKFHMNNESSEVRNVTLKMFANAKYYTGIPGEEIDEFKQEVELAPNSTKEIHWDIKAVDYLDALDEDATMAIYAMAKVHETKQCFSQQETFDVDKPDIEIRVLGVAKKGEMFLAELSFTNNLSVRLTQCRLTVEGPGIQKAVNVPIKNVLHPNGRIVQRVQMTPRVTGKREIIANFHSRQVTGITGSAEVDVKPASA